MKNDSPLIVASTQAEIIHKLQEKLRNCYIFPDVAEEICARLEKYQLAGEYSQYMDGNIFALALTMHLQEVNHDEHLWVKWHEECLPENNDQLRLDPIWQEARRQEARLDNFGLHKLERLQGGVGYMDIHYFHRPAWGGEAVVAAMSYLSHSQALIIDLRQCQGGYPGMVALFCSYLFGEEPLHLTSIYWRDDDFIQQYWTYGYIPGKRLAELPVYVLTSKVTFSAGELFAHFLQSRKRATIIGEKTDGGANAGVSYQLHPHFEAFIPIGRTIDPLTGDNWEGSGVSPDILVTQAESFTHAYRLALQSVIAHREGAPAAPLRHLAGEARIALKELDQD